MIWVVIIISIIYIIMLALILQAYYKNISDLENRILGLEKRVNELEKEGDNMPCGRKGRPKGSKNSGGGKRK